MSPWELSLWKLHIFCVVIIIWALTRSGANVHYLQLDSFHVTAWSKCHMICWLGSSHSSYHPAKFAGLAPCKDEIFLVCHMTTWLIFPWLCGWGPFILSHHPATFGVHRPFESGNVTTLICLVTTWSICYLTLWLGSLHPKSPSC